MRSTTDLDRVCYLLLKEGYKINYFERINSGRNSSAWMLKEGDKKFFLKFYRDNPQDERDRIGAEIAFLDLLLEENIKNVPKPLYFSREHKWSLLSWIEGVRIYRPNRQHWYQVASFISNLQSFNIQNRSSSIGNASEACFTLTSHQNEFVVTYDNYSVLQLWVLV